MEFPHIPPVHVDGGWTQGHGVDVARALGELQGLVTVLPAKAGQSPPQAFSARLRPVPPGAASPLAERVLPGTAGGPPQDTLLPTSDLPPLLWHLLGVRCLHGSQLWLCTLVPPAGTGMAGRDSAQRLCTAQQSTPQKHPSKRPSAARSTAHPELGEQLPPLCFCCFPQPTCAGRVPCPGAS